MGMAPSLSASATASASSRGHKLRSSCNSCGIAKVKCDRSQPSCRRCLSLSVACVYGQSRKSGRPPRSATIQSTHHPRRLVTERELPFVRAGEITEGVATTVAAAQHLVPPPTPGISVNEDGMDRLGQARSESASWMDPYISGPWSDLGIAPFDLIDPRHQTPGSNSPAPWRDSHVSGWKGCAATPDSQHVCSRESYQILADLICPAAHLHPPETNNGTVTAHLDQVLHCARKAVSRLMPLLRCSCAKSLHRVMIHAAIVSRILMWYQQAIAPVSQQEISSSNSNATSTIDTTSRSSSLSSETWRDLTRTTGFVVINTPTTLGTFNIEDQRLQTKICLEVVLGELEKMSELIELFGSLFPGTGGSIGIAGGLYAHATGWIKDEYVRITNDLRDRCAGLSSSYEV